MKLCCNRDSSCVTLPCIVQAQPKRVWIILWTIEITTFNFTADFGFPYYGVQGCANLFLAPVFLAAAPSYVFFYTCLASPETACKVILFVATLWPWAASYHRHNIFDLLYHPHNHQERHHNFYHLYHPCIIIVVSYLYQYFIVIITWLWFLAGFQRPWQDQRLSSSL